MSLPGILSLPFLHSLLSLYSFFFLSLKAALHVVSSVPRHSLACVVRFCDVSIIFCIIMFYVN